MKRREQLCFLRLMVQQTVDLLSGGNIYGCVGSSHNHMEGDVSNAFAKTTFCWLPPDNSQADWEVPVQRIFRAFIISLQQKQQLLLKTAPFWNNGQ